MMDLNRWKQEEYHYTILLTRQWFTNRSLPLNGKHFLNKVFGSYQCWNGGHVLCRHRFVFVWIFRQVKDAKKSHSNAESFMFKGRSQNAFSKWDWVEPNNNADN